MHTVDHVEEASMPGQPHVAVVGAGIGGLTLALELHAAGIGCQVFEAAPALGTVGVGINLLPHATRELARVGLEAKLGEVGVATRESVFFNRFGQLIYAEPAGRYAGYGWPQFSIHRGDLHAVLLEAVAERLGPDGVVLGRRCRRVEQDGRGATVIFDEPTEDGAGGPAPPVRASVVVGCDGIHSTVRRQLHPEEGPPRYSGVNMWRGVTRWPPFLTGASMVRVGWLATGKLVLYPVRDADARGRQLVNWVAEIETPHHRTRDWNRPGDLADFLPAVEDWHFDWLDVPALLHASEVVLEYPMVDQDPLERWSFGRVTLLGDAAHPMVPRGSNGAGQAIVDARVLADCLAEQSDPAQALEAYESARLEATASVVRMNRTNPPDAILREVYLRTGDRPFASIDDVISADELAALSDNYKTVAGYAKDSLGHPHG
ncbi:MAG: flavin-dependent oxidoreductase [Carbonactinosporaceae bacterium]